MKKSTNQPGGGEGTGGGDEAPADRARLWGLLGDLPDREAGLAARTISAEARQGYRVERLLLDLNGLEEVPAIFVRPAEGERFPAIVYSHAHGGDHILGKEELLRGRPELQPLPYAEALAARGFAVLGIDAWNFGERRGRAESELFKELLWKGRVLYGLMVFDCLRAIDWLVTRPDIDARRIGVLGMGMGGALSWWAAALDERVAAVADICSLSDFHVLAERRGLDGHGLHYFVPGLLKHFTTAGIQALIGPRPHLSLAGDFDPLTPPEGLDRIDRQLKQLYGNAGAAGAWRLLRYKVGHAETAAMRAETLLFLTETLGDA